jgi:hypothetical protein
MSIWYFAQKFRPKKVDWSNADLERTDGEDLSAPDSGSDPQTVTTPTTAQLDGAPWFHLLVDVPIGEANHVIVYLDGVASAYRSPDGGGLLEVLRLEAGTVVEIGSDAGAEITGVTVQTAIPRLEEY